MRIAITTAWDHVYAPIAEITVPLMARYCERNGYGFEQRPNYYFGFDAQMPEGGFPPEINLIGGDRCKVRLYKELYDSYDAVCWIDVDTLVMNSSVRVESILGDRPFVWPYDVSGPNTGSYIARTIPPVHAFLHQSIHYSTEHFLGDAKAMRDVGLLIPHREIADNCISGKAYGHCYDYARYGWSPLYDYIGNYEPGDFLLTWPAITVGERVQNLRLWAGRAT